MAPTITLIFLAVAAVMCVAGAPLMMKKIPPNAFYGVRIPSTLRDEEAWYRANEAFGRHLMILGVLVAVLVTVLRFVPDVSSRSTALACGAVLISGLALIAFNAVMLARRHGKSR
jgi:hypothetical protein